MPGPQATRLTFLHRRRPDPRRPLVHSARPQGRWRCLVLATVGLVLLVPLSRAATVPDLYEARVQLADGGATALDRAFAEALNLVLIKVSGRRSLPGGGLVSSPGSLVRQYQPLPGGGIRVLFDPAAVRGRLDGAGLPVWGAERPGILLWLVLPGSGGQILTEGPLPTPVRAGSPEVPTPAPVPQDQALRRALMDTANARGLPVVLPQPGTSPGLDPSVPREVASRLGLPVVLVGESTGGGDTWRWRLIMTDSAGSEAEWPGDIPGGIHGLADRLAARYATTVAGIRQTLLQVTGIRDFARYSRLQQSLAALDDVEAVAVREVRGDTVVFILTVRADDRRLRELLSRQGLVPVTDAGFPGGDPVFRLGPETP